MRKSAARPGRALADRRASHARSCARTPSIPPAFTSRDCRPAGRRRPSWEPPIPIFTRPSACIPVCPPGPPATFHLPSLRCARGAMASGGRTRFCPTIVFHGDEDAIVNPRNGDAVIAQAAAAATGLQSRIERGQVPGGRRYRREIHADAAGHSVSNGRSMAADTPGQAAAHPAPIRTRGVRRDRGGGPCFERVDG